MALSEHDLVSKIEKILQKEYKTELTFREVSAGYGIADLVIAPSARFAKTRVERSPITHFGTLKFFLDLDKRSYTFEQLCLSARFVPVKEVRKYVAFLKTNGYLLFDGTVYTKSNILESEQPIQRIIAIEAKLTDYKNGIIQAKRYQYFADQSYLAILKKPSSLIDIKSLRKSGIGLIVFDEESESIKIFEPYKNIKFQESIYRTFAREMMISRMELRASS